MSNKEEKIKELYETKIQFVNEKDKTIKKFMSKGQESGRRNKMINFNFNPSKYKYKEIVPIINTDKFNLLEKEYSKKGIPYSPFLINTPDELLKKTEDKQKEEDFDYYKRHILLENYDEKPESKGEIVSKLEKIKLENNGIVDGFTKWFDNDGNRVWKNCEILKYDEIEKLFHICVYNSQGKEIFKKVTRFNVLIQNESPNDIENRIKGAEYWKNYAKKYMAFYHFVSSFTIENIPNQVNDNFLDKVLFLAFLYRSNNKPQLTPLQVHELDNSLRFGIWRRHAKKRKIEIDKKKLNKFLLNKNLSISKLQDEIQEYYHRSFKMMEFYTKLPLNYDLFMLLNDILPQDKFMMSSERFLHSSNHKGILEVSNRKYNYLKVFKKCQTKLHQSEEDAGLLIIEINKRMVEDLRDKIFFYKNWFVKPISLSEFKIKNRENIETIFKEIQFLLGNGNYEIIKFLKERLKIERKINKGATLSKEILRKFRHYEDLLNRKIATYTRDIFHKSMNYMTEIFRNINKKVNITKEISNLNIDDILQIRDDYCLEDYFYKSFDILQFQFEMTYSNSAFNVEPHFETWWKSIEKIVRKNIISRINTCKNISVYDLLSDEEQNNYHISKEDNLIVFYEDDKSYEDELNLHKNEMWKFYSPITRFLEILNTDVKKHLSELLDFSKDIKNKNYDEDSLNIETFRYFINMNKQYLNFFNETFKYENFFLGGILINTKTTKEFWINRLNDIKDLIFKLIIDNNVYLSKKMEEEKELIEKILEEEPLTVDEYDNLLKYCDNLNEPLKVIWKRINSQQMNAELLEENYFLLKKEDFFKMWSCYGIPRHLYFKKQDTIARMELDRKKFKRELKQKYTNTLLEISRIRSDYESSTVILDIDNYEKYYNTFSDLNYRIEKMIKQCAMLNDHQVIIGLKVTDLSEIKEIYNNFLNYYQLWEAVYNFESRKITWMNEVLKKVDRKLLKTTYDQCNNTLDRLEKSIFRKDKPAPNSIINLLREKIKEFQPYLPILYDLINPDFKPNHIHDLSKTIGVEIPDDLNVNLNELINRGIVEHMEDITERSTYATGQKKLALNLEKIKERYKSLKFDTMFYKSSDLIVLKDVEPISEEIDTLLTKVVSISSSKFAKYLQKDVQIIWQNLSRAQEIIDIWLKVQKLIGQQHEIFHYGDLKKQLQEEVSKYDFVEKQWRLIMDQLKMSPLVSEVCLISKIKENFAKSLQTLEEINKSLNSYLNTKRDVFPRFYFVSNEELIMMLAQSGDPKTIALNYIQQVFDGMKRLNIIEHENINNENNNIENVENYNIGEENPTNTFKVNKIIFDSMISEQGEIVNFINKINPYEEVDNKDGKVTRNVLLESWLNDIEKEMFNTLKENFKNCYTNLISENSIREQWVGEHIEQAILTISQLDWTNKVTNAILTIQEMTDENSLINLLKIEKESLSKLIKKIRSKENSKLLKKTLVSLIIQDVHANDVISYLIENKVNNLTQFEWVAQLRYYFITRKEDILGINVKMLNTERQYDYEYLGNQKRLVITPLTDRCYRTMMEALHNCLGGAPEGPAGTGKTETIKDLSKNLGKKCFTYNCSEESDYVLMTKFFKGIAMSGCWICLDEFNRISVDVLSVIAYQISILLTTLKSQSYSCIFEGAVIQFNPNMGIFITMNPDYAGRSDLPDNLKALFRPLAMMIPNYDMIAEIMLYSFGFNNARNLSRKIVSSLRLASEQLSSQDHYDYGMRTLNGIITYIGILSAERNEESLTTNNNILIEEYIVEKAIRDSNMPKFTLDDYKIYEGILSDLFPVGEFVDKSDNILINQIKNQMTNFKLTESEFLINKVVDFNNIMSVRHAVMIVGEPMAHKSTILKLYLNAIPDYYKEMNIDRGVKHQIINPKSITSQQLFGYVNKKSMDFFEGVCSKALRDYFADTSNDLKLLVFDGPVDTMWIENMNSVLDDTKKLCLENSDQIRLDDKTFVIFEVDDLSQASLATISRCGMVYTDRNNINSFDYFYAWIKTLPDSFSDSNFIELLKNLFEHFYEILLTTFLFDEYNNFLFKSNLPIFKNWLMKSFINILEALIFCNVNKEEMIENEIERNKNLAEQADTNINLNKTNTHSKSNKKFLNKIERKELLNKFIYAIFVSLCWILDNTKDQKIFVDKINEMIKENMNSTQFLMKEELLNFSKHFVGKDLTEFIFNTSENNWVQIQDILQIEKENTILQIKSSNNLVIPTIQTYKAFNIIRHCQKTKLPLLFYGPTGSGKTLVIKDYLKSNFDYLNQNNWMNFTFILNSKTSANNICDLIEDKITFKLKKNTVAPPNNKKSLILIEDLNMPVKEKYGAQPSIEILRQFFDYGGWYDRKEKEFLNLKNILIFSFLTIGRPLVSSRLLWHFLVLPMNEMDDIALKEVYSTLFMAKFFDHPASVRKLQNSFVEALVSSYKNVVKIFRPLPITPHYSFNTRDLNKVFEGLTMVSPKIITTQSEQSDYMRKLLIHETECVYGDRLINETDRFKFKQIILQDINKHFKSHLLKDALVGLHLSTTTDEEMILFSEINDDFSYKKVDHLEMFKNEIYRNIDEFNFNRKAKEKIDLILFDYSLRHMLRIDRILTRENENGLLIGLTGSGRQSLTNIISFIKKYKIFQIRSRDQVEEYGKREWLEDIKTLFKNSGLMRESTVFLIRDNNIVEESMYVDLNCLISSGIVYNLFTNDEKAEWLGSIKQIKEFEDLNIHDDQALWDVFITKTIQKIRVVICMNPLNENFTKILRQFPALINNTTIDWYESWPESALFYLAQREFTKEDFTGSIILDKDIKELKPKQIVPEFEDDIIIEEEDIETKHTKLINNLSFIFSKTYDVLTLQNEEYFNMTRKKVIILPKSYLDFVNFFKSFYYKQFESHDRRIKKYEDGVRKIYEADEEIKKMRETLETKKPMLVEKGKYLEVTIREIESQTKEAEENRRICEENEKHALLKRTEAEDKKSVAEKNKYEAEILKEEINKKILMIDHKQFMALRSFRVPPKEVTKMMQPISLIMSNFEKKPMENLPKEWEFYKKKLNDVKLMKTLEGLPKKLETTLLQDKVCKLLEPFVNDPDLEPAYMEKKISSTCACFCAYFKNMYLLDDILKNKIIPSIRDSEAATQAFTEAQDNLDKEMRNLMEVESRLATLTSSFNEKNFEKQQLEFEISEIQKKLIRAERLTSKLGGEKNRWAEIAINNKRNKIYLFGDLIISAIYISFMGPFLNTFREEFIRNHIFPILEEKKILFSKICSISKIIGNPFVIQDWIINGLPSDSGSIDNAIILFESNRQSLLVDPQNQAVKFLNKLYKNDFILFKQSEVPGNSNNVKEIAANYQIMENCIKNGKILVFDNISYDVIPEVESLMNAEIITNSTSKFMRLGEQDIPLHYKFRFFLISYSGNPIFNPDLYAKVSIINFSVTKSALTEQLVSVIIKEESPKDEMERITILQNRFLLEDTINKMEEQILEKLNANSDNLLDNDSLIVNLEESKKLSDEAHIQINSAKITQEKLENFRQMYVILANLGTLIFFTISELYLLEPIYQFSISWFIKEIVIQSIKDLPEKPKTTTIEKRIESLSKSLLEKAYKAVCRSLLNKDKILFSFLMMVRKLQMNDELTQEEMQYLCSDIIKTNVDESIMDNLVLKRPEFIDNLKWNKIIKLDTIKSYYGIVEDILNNQAKWKKYFTSDHPDMNFPSENYNKLNVVKKLLLIKIVNLEKMIHFIKIIIDELSFSEELSKIPLFTINDLYEMSKFSTPLMLLMTSGMDPSQDVKRIAEENNKELITVSLGQGQETKALSNIDMSQKKGLWVYLQNLHLTPDFMKYLEPIIAGMQSADKLDINPQFRLWISALPSNNILSSILVNSLKITLESPIGVKANLTKLIKSQQKIWTYDLDLMLRVNKEFEFTKFFIGLMHFHSILLERKSYGPLGWNVKYSFNESDFLISKTILKSNLEKHSHLLQNSNQDEIPNLPYKAIVYLTADCIYGGRVTDDWDRRTLFSILDDFYNDKVLHEDVYIINKQKEYNIEYFETFDQYFNRFTNELIEEETPELVGLHKNALIRKQMEQSGLLLSSLANLDKGDSSNLNLINRTNNLNNILELINKKLPKNINIEEVKKKYPIRYEDCMNSILIQEIMRYNSLLYLVFNSLNETVQAYQGLIPLTDQIEECADQLSSNITPSLWLKASYPTRKPIASWINDLEKRIKFFYDWINNGVPKEFWFSAFFFTQSFLTGIKQNFARKHKISIDKLEFTFTFVNNEDYNKSLIDDREAYYTYGLFIEGASWSRTGNCLDELNGKNISEMMPPIILTVKDCENEDDKEETVGNYIYQCPVYKCSTRHGSLSTTGHSTNYIFTVNMPSLISPNHWVKRGVALLNQLDD